MRIMRLSLIGSLAVAALAMSPPAAAAMHDPGSDPGFSTITVDQHYGNSNQHNLAAVRDVGAGINTTLPRDAAIHTVIAIGRDGPDTRRLIHVIDDTAPSDYERIDGTTNIGRANSFTSTTIGGDTGYTGAG